MVPDAPPCEHCKRLATPQCTLHGLQDIEISLALLLVHFRGKSVFIMMF